MERPSFTAPRTPVDTRRIQASRTREPVPPAQKARSAPCTRARSRPLDAGPRTASCGGMFTGCGWPAPTSGTIAVARYPVCLNSFVERPSTGYLAGASSPASSTLRAMVFPSTTWSSPISESRTVLPTTRTFRPRTLFAITLSVT